MTRGLLFAVLLASLAVAEARAGVVSESSGPPVGPETGGVDVSAAGDRVRLRCWQNGRKILDESELVVTSLSIASQTNSIGFRRPGASEPGGALITQIWTTCLLTPEDE